MHCLKRGRFIEVSQHFCPSLQFLTQTLPNNAAIVKVRLDKRVTLFGGQMEEQIVSHA